ncbi:hypothetical protein DCC62_00435 [candidate division KSB1 bacterium]|nr:MAG: hypothetical protein DCC62_00435 [candidate division KSB1 bacterium]
MIVNTEQPHQFDNLMKGLAGGDWRRTDLSRFGLRHFREFGAYIHDTRPALYIIDRLLILTLKSKSEFSLIYARAFCDAIDFHALGAQASTDKIQSVVILLRLLNRIGIQDEVFNDFFDLLDFKALGVQASQTRVRMSTIDLFLRFGRQSGAKKAALIDFCKALDFSALAVQVTAEELSIVISILHSFRQVGVTDEILDVFFDGIDFRALGIQASQPSIKITRVEQFLRSARQSGADESSLRTFCGALDFQALGIRASRRTTRMATINGCLELFREFGAKKSSIKAFCEALDLRDLGRRARVMPEVRRFIQYSRESGAKKSSIKVFCEALDFKRLGFNAAMRRAGILAIRRFLRQIQTMNVVEEKIHTFVESLNWRAIGRRAMNDKLAQKAPALLFHFLLNADIISQKNCREFVEGFGWENLKVTSSSFSPEALAVARLFLRKKCQFDVKTLAKNGLNWSSQNWLHAFTTNSCNNKISSIKWAKGFLKDALNRSHIERSASALYLKKMDLRSWNILTHNLKIISPHLVESCVSSILCKKSVAEFERLFCESDLRSISMFLMKFNPHCGVFAWQLSNYIDFTRIDFEKKVAVSSLDTLAFLLFNFFYVQRNDCAQFFSQQLDTYQSLLLQLVSQANLRTVDLFLWNWCLGMPTGNRPTIMHKAEFHQRIFRHVETEKSREEDLLGIVGTMHLFGYDIPQYFLHAIDCVNAEGICKRITAKEDVRMIRMLAGLLKVSSRRLGKKEKHHYLLSVEKLEKKLHTSVHSGETVLRKLKSLLFEA